MMLVDGFLIARLIGEWLFGFSALISIINPLGVAFIFSEKTRNLPAAEHKRLAGIVTRNCFFVLVASMFLGSPILSFFGISLEALRIAGGLVVATTGWSMLSAEVSAGGPSDRPEAVDSRLVMRQTFFPLTMPLTIGPGAIATAIALAAGRSSSSSGLLVDAISSLLIAVSVCAVIWVAYRNADGIERRLGPDGTLVATKLSAFLLMCVGVQIMLTGVSDALQRLWPAGH